MTENELRIANFMKQEMDRLRELVEHGNINTVKGMIDHEERDNVCVNMYGVAFYVSRRHMQKAIDDTIKDTKRALERATKQFSKL